MLVDVGGVMLMTFVVMGGLAGLGILGGIVVSYVKLRRFKQAARDA